MKKLKKIIFAHFLAVKIFQSSVRRILVLGGFFGGTTLSRNTMDAKRKKKTFVGECWESSRRSSLAQVMNWRFLILDSNQISSWSLLVFDTVPHQVIKNLLKQLMGCQRWMRNVNILKKLGLVSKYQSETNFKENKAIQIFTNRVRNNFMHRRNLRCSSTL